MKMLKYVLAVLLVATFVGNLFSDIATAVGSYSVECTDNGRDYVVYYDGEVIAKPKAGAGMRAPYLIRCDSKFNTKNGPIPLGNGSLDDAMRLIFDRTVEGTPANSEGAYNFRFVKNPADGGALRKAFDKNGGQNNPHSKAPVYRMGEQAYKDCTESASPFDWVVCPMLDWIYGVVLDTFDIVEKFLVIDSAILDTEGQNAGVFIGWQTFLGFANVILVIIFILIIVSQVTGFGIDNYGIKKMLPRLIVLAILINLSFIVCQLAVDLSNIVGGGVYRLLIGLSGDLGFANASAAGITALAAAFGAIAGIVITAIINPVVLLPLLLVVLGGVISVLFMFLLLGVRQAAVAIFVILAPLAFAMNILPNTAGLFKKWFNIFKVLLLMYPICGLIMGGSLYGAMLLMSISPGGEAGGTDHKGNLIGFIFGIVSLVLLFVPIFFIPKLVKGAFDSLGKIGAAIGGLGGRFGSFAKGKVEGSERYKDMQNRGVEYRNRGVMDRLGKKIESGKELSGYQKRKYTRALDASLEAKKKEGNVDNKASAGYRAAAEDNVGDLVFDNEVAVRQSALRRNDDFMRNIGDFGSGAYADIARSFTDPNTTNEEKTAMLAEMAKTKPGRQHMRDLFRNNALGGFDRLEMKNALARQSGVMSELHNKAGDVEDFVNQTGVTMADATRNYTFKGADLANMDDSTVTAIADPVHGAGAVGVGRLHAAGQEAVNSDITKDIGIHSAAYTYIDGKGKTVVQGVDLVDHHIPDSNAVPVKHVPPPLH